MKYFTVGPTQMHEQFRTFLDDALERDLVSVSHRSKWFVDMYHELTTHTKQLFGAPDIYETVFLGSATECMERAIQNMSTTETLHFVSGSFGARCATFAEAAGRKVTVVKSRADGAFYIEDIPAAISPQAVFFTHSETSVGNRLPKEFIEVVCDMYPNALTAVDVVSSAPVCDIPVERMDCVFYSIQKGFGLPAGLGVALLSPKAVAFSQSLFAAGTYNGLFHSFPSLVKQGKEGKTLETPNVLGMHLLNEVTKNFLTRGVKHMRKETQDKASLVYTFLDTHAPGTTLSPAITHPAWRSETVIVANTPLELGGSAPIIAKCKEAGFLIASGYNTDKDIKVRIANFPQHTKEDVERLLSLLA